MDLDIYNKNYKSRKISTTYNLELRENICKAFANNIYNLE
jgi:hypothetical protein